MDPSSDFVENIISLYKQNNWKEIINKYCDSVDKSKLLWVFPSEENIKFFNNVLKDADIHHVISVGCGSGLLEWIISESLEITLTCIEIDDAWWKCKYAPPTFSPLHFAQPDLDSDESTKKILKNDNAAMMFCYFNNRDAFDTYMKLFTGSVLIIIGPGEGRHTHTDPLPFEPNIDNMWQLKAFQEVRNSKDYIVVYHKKSD